MTQWPCCGHVPPWGSENPHSQCSCPGTLLGAVHLRGVPWKVPSCVLLVGAICQRSYMEIKCVMSYVSGKGWCEENDPKSLSVVYLGQLYIYSVPKKKTFVWICLASYSYQFQPQNFIYIATRSTDWKVWCGKKAGWTDENKLMQAVLLKLVLSPLCCILPQHHAQSRSRDVGVWSPLPFLFQPQARHLPQAWALGWASRGLPAALLHACSLSCAAQRWFAGVWDIVSTL